MYSAAISVETGLLVSDILHIRHLESPNEQRSQALLASISLLRGIWHR